VCNASERACLVYVIPEIHVKVVFVPDTKVFTRSTLGSDLPAGLVVFLVALPLCLGVALASGAPLFSGMMVDTNSHRLW